MESATKRSLNKHNEVILSTRIARELKEELGRVSDKTGISEKRIITDSLIAGLAQVRLRHGEENIK